MLRGSKSYKLFLTAIFSGFILFSAAANDADATLIDLDLLGSLSSAFGSFSAGDTFTLSGRYDDAQPNENLSSGFYTDPFVSGWELFINGSLVDTGTSSSLSVLDNILFVTDQGNLIVNGSTGNLVNSVGIHSEMPLDNFGIGTMSLLFPNNSSTSFVNFALAGGGNSVGNQLTGISSIAVTDPGAGGPGGTPTAPVPEPATMILLGTGLLGLVAWNMRKNKSGAEIEFRA